MAPHVTGFFHDLHIPQWSLHLRVMIYRKHLGHASPKSFQLDLFTPDDGHFEYSAVATNLALDLTANTGRALTHQARPVRSDNPPVMPIQAFVRLRVGLPGNESTGSLFS